MPNVNEEEIEKSEKLCHRKTHRPISLFEEAHEVHSSGNPYKKGRRCTSGSVETV